MPKFKSKQKVITAVRFNPDRPPLPANVRTWSNSVDEPIEGFEVYNKLHSSWIKIKPGDYIRIDDLNDTYPIDAAYMAANYDEVEDTDADSKPSAG